MQMLQQLFKYFTDSGLHFRLVATVYTIVYTIYHSLLYSAAFSSGGTSSQLGEQAKDRVPKRQPESLVVGRDDLGPVTGEHDLGVVFIQPNDVSVGPPAHRYVTEAVLRQRLGERGGGTGARGRERGVEGEGGGDGRERSERKGTPETRCSERV